MTRATLSGLGILVGGRDLEGPQARYVADLIRRDGTESAVESQGLPHRRYGAKLAIRLTVA